MLKDHLTGMEDLKERPSGLISSWPHRLLWVSHRVLEYGAESILYFAEYEIAQQHPCTRTVVSFGSAQGEPCGAPAITQ